MKEFDESMCLWVGSLGIDYKLCCNNFNCKNCYFDKQLRSADDYESAESSELSVYSRIIERLANEVYSPSFIFLKNKLILKNLFGNKYYIGLSPISLLFLPNTIEIKFNTDSIYIKRGEPFLELITEWGSVVYTASFDFTLLWKSTEISDKLHPEMWFALVEVIPDELNLDKLDGLQYNSDKNRIADILQEYQNVTPACSSYKNHRVSERPELYCLLGKEKYLALLEKVFNYSTIISNIIYSN